MAQVPSVGRMVHFHQPTGEDLAAIITKVMGGEDQRVCLTVFPSADMRHTVSVQREYNIPLGEGPNTWHWPEYVSEVATAQPRGARTSALHRGGKSEELVINGDHDADALEALKHSVLQPRGEPERDAIHEAAPTHETHHQGSTAATRHGHSHETAHPSGDES